MAGIKLKLGTLISKIFSGKPKSPNKPKQPKNKSYYILEDHPGYEIRLYKPIGRTVYLMRRKDYAYICFPYILFGCSKANHNLFAALVLDDISKYPTKQLNATKLYRMPFGHFYNKFGPCCMPVDKSADNIPDTLIDVFWKSAFVYLGYQDSIKLYSKDVDFSNQEEFEKHLRSLPSYFGSDYDSFVRSLILHG